MDLIESAGLGDDSGVFFKLCDPPVFSAFNGGGECVHDLVLHSDLLVDFEGHEVVDLVVSTDGDVFVSDPDAGVVAALFDGGG